MITLPLLETIADSITETARDVVYLVEECNEGDIGPDEAKPRILDELKKLVHYCQQAIKQIEP